MIYNIIYIIIYINESLCLMLEAKHNIINQLYFNKIKIKKKRWPSGWSMEIKIRISAITG